MNTHLWWWSARSVEFCNLLRFFISLIPKGTTCYFPNLHRYFVIACFEYDVYVDRISCVLAHTLCVFLLQILFYFQLCVGVRKKISIELIAYVTAMLSGALQEEPRVNYLYENVAVRQSEGQDGKWSIWIHDFFLYRTFVPFCFVQFY